MSLHAEEHAKWEKALDNFTMEWIKKQDSNSDVYEKILKIYKENLEKYK